MPPSIAETIEVANDVLIARRDADSTEKFFAPEYVVHGPDADVATGPAFVRSFLGMLHRAFSNLEVSVEILAETEDRVAWQRTVTAIHRGNFMGFPATGGRIAWRDMIVSRFSDGLIVEEWAVSDLAERLLRARKTAEGEDRH